MPLKTGLNQEGNNMYGKAKQESSNSIENTNDGMELTAMELFVYEINVKNKWSKPIFHFDEVIEETLTSFIEIIESYDEIKALGLKDLLFGRQSPILPWAKTTFNLSQAAKQMNISEKTLRKGINAGYFIGKKSGRIWCFNVSQLEHNLKVLSQRE